MSTCTRSKYSKMVNKLCFFFLRKPSWNLLTIKIWTGMSLTLLMLSGMTVHFLSHICHDAFILTTYSCSFVHAAPQKTCPSLFGTAWRSFSRRTACMRSKCMKQTRILLYTEENRVLISVQQKSFRGFRKCIRWERHLLRFIQNMDNNMGLM